MRQKNTTWNIGDPVSWDGAKLAVLMDLRDELQTANRLNQDIASSLNTIRHFFHQHGMQSAIRELLRRENVKARRHAARKKAARAKAKAKRSAV